METPSRSPSRASQQAARGIGSDRAAIVAGVSLLLTAEQIKECNQKSVAPLCQSKSARSRKGMGACVNIYRYSRLIELDPKSTPFLCMQNHYRPGHRISTAFVRDERTRSFNPPSESCTPSFACCQGASHQVPALRNQGPAADTPATPRRLGVASTEVLLILVVCISWLAEHRVLH